MYVYAYFPDFMIKYSHFLTDETVELTVTRLQRWEYVDINELHDAHDNYSGNDCYDSDNNETVT